MGQSLAAKDWNRSKHNIRPRQSKRANCRRVQILPSALSDLGRAADRPRGTFKIASLDGRCSTHVPIVAHWPDLGSPITTRCVCSRHLIRVSTYV